MSILFLLNIIIINIIAWLAISYFWSYWTYKLFKPFKWLDKNKQKDVNPIIKRCERKMKDKNRFYTIWFEIERIKKHDITGDIAEFGVYKGETAKILHHLMPDKKLLLFDSFTGLPKQVIKEDCDGKVRPQTVNFGSTSKKEVIKYINGNDNIFIYEGIFPQTTEAVTNHTFCFVHLDADLYQSTLDGLRFFYPRLTPGGSILIHDYNHDWEGVTKAVDEFEKSIPEQFVHMVDMYGSVILTKNKI